MKVGKAVIRCSRNVVCVPRELFTHSSAIQKLDSRIRGRAPPQCVSSKLLMHLLSGSQLVHMYNVLYKQRELRNSSSPRRIASF